MTPAERKFRECDAGLHRAQAFIRVLREVVEADLSHVDVNLWNGIVAIVGEAETSIDATAELWREGVKLTSRT